ncbi:hypothetical protein [Microbacterium deminutum]
MAGINSSADIAIGDRNVPPGAGPEPSPSPPPPPAPPEPDVLELRVHGVNNTTPAALLDVPADSVELASGDKLGSFWQSTANPAEGRHGHVPLGIRREAYSWGGMVRTTPQFGGSGTASKIAAVGARIFYALILPFSIGNAVIWSRRITQPGDSGGRRVWIAITAGIARLFGLILTLLFTTTLVTLAIDIGALQCAADATRCEPLKAVFEPMQGWSPGQRVALLSLVPVAAIVVLWIMSAVSRLRYDVLPGMETHVEEAGPADDVGADADGPAAPQDQAPIPPHPPASAVLAVPGFWSNRVTRHLARVHLAGAVALVAGFAGAQGSLGWRSSCEGVDLSASCLPTAQDRWFVTYAVLACAAALLLLASAVLVTVIPTMTIQPEEERGAKWPNTMSIVLLTLAFAVLAGILILLAFGPTAPDLMSGATTKVDRLYGAGNAPLVLVVAGAVCALSGVTWRPAADRWKTAWSGCAPAVFMTLALAVAAGSSAIVVVMIGDWLNGSKGPTALLGWTKGDAPATSGRIDVQWTDSSGATGETTIGGPPTAALDLRISRSYVALGALILIGVVVSAMIVTAIAFLRPRDVTARASAWDAPPASPIPVPGGGVLPPSSKALLSRIEAKRRSAARLHLVEPAVGVITTTLAIAIVLAVVWIWWATTTDESLWSIGSNEQFIVNILDVGMLGLTGVGALLVAVLAAGASSGGTRPLGIVWDIACYLPQTGHPFGPPCYAERAVPEIAGRLNAWLRRPERRAVLAAHSMGGVLAVSSLALLASVASTRTQLTRISLLTFGVQLRPFFGRMLPELLGPAVFGVEPAHRPRLWSRDPWSADFHAQRDAPAPGQFVLSTEQPAVGRLSGTMVSEGTDFGTPVRWVSLWRASDFLGFPAMSTVRAAAGGGWRNDIDRYAGELDTTGYMVSVGTHGEYYRATAYDEALRQLAGIPPAAPGP